MKRWGDRPAISREQEAAICARYQSADVSLRDLRREFGVSIQGLADLLERRGIRKRQRGNPKAVRRAYLREGGAA